MQIDRPGKLTRPSVRRWVPPRWQVIAWLVGLAITLPIEIGRYLPIHREGGEPATWLLNMNVDTTPALIVLLLAPFLWFLPRLTIRRRPLLSARSSPWFGDSTRPGSDRSRETDWRDWVLAVAVAVVSLSVSAGVALTRVQENPPVAFGDLPPAYHDEYSYLFMAKTFLAGRTWSPGHSSLPELFDQMHVLNEGQMASRYFPGTGAWMAPFVAVGHPYLGHWLAGTVCAFFIFWAGRELGGNGVGLFAGLLTAVAPGMAAFSNLLLAHHPTLVGLSLFLFAFLRLTRTGSYLDCVAAGAGLTFAMLCRPMTAAGFGFPFGIWLLVWLLRGWGLSNFGFRLTRLVAVGAPLLVGFGAVYAYNESITGSGLKSPYEEYLEVYTPRHVYGFDNVIRGEQRLGEKVIDDYDRWAENLTPALAVRNVWRRLLASWQWTLGIVPLVIAAVVFPRYAADEDRRWWLIAAAILTLHLAHVPYWYEGIMGYHYVFETGPLWLLVFAGSTRGLFGDWRARGRAWMPLWWTSLAAVSLMPQYFVIEPLWWQSRVGQEIRNITYSRWKHAAFQEAIDRYITKRPALVLVSQSLHELHVDYVINDPGLTDAVLIGRWRPGQTDLAKVLEDFPERSIYCVLAESDEPLSGIGPARFERIGSFPLPPERALIYRVLPER